MTPPLRRFPREGSAAQTGDFSIAESPLLPRFTPSGFVPVLPKCCPLCPSRTPFAWNKARLRSRHPLELSPRNTHPNPAGLWASKPSETSRSRRSVESSPSAPAEPLCLEQGTAAPPPPYRVVPQEYACFQRGFHRPERLLCGSGFGP